MEKSLPPGTVLLGFESPIIILKYTVYQVPGVLGGASLVTGYLILNEGELTRIGEATVQYYRKHGTLNIYEA